jgi:dihydrodiol dehydrogenase / D-xylose 1-dehydrogenase (NADP)
VKDPASHREEHDIKHIIQAIGSSSLSRAQEFVRKHVAPAGVPEPKCYDSYEGVYSDPDVDIVYVATPHSLHHRNTIDAIEAGKHVLCEKPIAINAKEAENMILAARSKGVFLMEGRYINLRHVLLRSPPGTDMDGLS